MRKLLVTLVLLIVIGGAVFFVGWIQVTLPANTYAVLFSKTSGWEAEVLAPGTFVWRWQRIIPTNMTVYRYELSPRRATAALSAALPSGDVYSAFLGEDASFDYDISVRVGYSVLPEALPRLAERRDLLPEDVRAYLDVVESVLSQRVSSIVTELVEDDSIPISQSAGYADVAETLASRLPQSFPNLEIISVDVTELSLPDMQLYRRARDAYLTYVDERAEALSDAAREVALDQAEAARDLDLLEHYGRILDSYPILLDYFALGKELDLDPLNLRDLTPPTTDQ